MGDIAHIVFLRFLHFADGHPTEVYHVDRFDPPLGHLGSDGTLTCRAVKDAVLGTTLYHVIYVPFLDVVCKVIAKSHGINPSTAKGIFSLILSFN